MSGETADPTTPPTADGAGGTSTPPATTNWQNEAEAYKKRFNGLQATYQKTHDELEALKALKFDLEQKNTTLTGEFEAKKLEWDKTREEREQALGELDILKANAERQKIILHDFPDLAELEAKELLPDGVGDELKGKLTAMRDFLKLKGQAATVEFTKGATPPQPGTGAPRSAADFLAEAKKAMAKGDFDQYDSLISEHLKATKA